MNVRGHIFAAVLLAITSPCEADAPAATPASTLLPLDALLDFAGISGSPLLQLDDSIPLGPEDEETLFRLLQQLERVTKADEDAWPTVPWQDVGERNRRGQALSIAGQVTSIRRMQLPEEVQRRYELVAYWQVEVASEDGTAVVVAREIPATWLRSDLIGTVDERAAQQSVRAKGVLLRTQPSRGDHPLPILVVKRLRWYPDEVQPGVNAGQRWLASQGFDIGSLHDAKDRRPLSAAEFAGFYGLLKMVEELPSSALGAAARENLESYRQMWQPAQREWHAPLPQSLEEPTARGIAEAVTKQAATGSFSVYPLFRDAARQRGQVVMLEGVALRATKILTSSTLSDEPSVAQAVFGLDFYYEVAIVTNDSQRQPLVLCLRELPEGFPLGETIREKVRCPAIFFKLWRYASRRKAEPQAPRPKEQDAPLLIGRSLTWLNGQKRARRTSGWIGGGVAAGLLLLGAGLWWQSRRDRVQERQLRSRYLSEDLSPDANPFEKTTSTPQQDD